LTEDGTEITEQFELIMFDYKVKTVYRQDDKCSFNSRMLNISNCRFYETFQVKFYINQNSPKAE
jgi:hypothetical protein